MDDMQVGPVSQTFEEIEAATKGEGAAPPKLDDVKVPDAEGVPEEFKGKSLAEIIKLTQGAGEALKASEQRRLALEEQARLSTAAGVAAPPEPKAEPELTREQLAELYQKDPLQAIEYMQAAAAKRVEDNVNKRLGTLVSGNTSAAEAAARAKYPDEFVLFGEQIAATIKVLPNREAMSQPQAWEDLVAYIRGKGDNFDKLVEHRIAKGRDTKAAEARAAQAATAGPATQSATRGAAAPVKGAEGLDALELEIAGKMGLTPTEYAKWKRVA